MDASTMTNGQQNLDLVPYLKTNPGIALIGATNDSSKYGNMIFCDLRDKGYTVWPVNPRATTVEGEKAYRDLESLHADHTVGLLVYVIPPRLTLESLKDAARLGLKKVWVQPGAGDEAVRSFLETNGFQFLMDACVMVETRG